MSKNNYIIDQIVKTRIKLPKSYDLTGKTVFCDIYDETDAKDVAKSGTMATYGGQTYKLQHSWTPDENGQWHAEIYVEEDATPGTIVYGPFVENYDVGDYDEQAIGAQGATTEAKVDIVQTGVTALDTLNTAMDGKLDNIQSNIVNGSDPPMLG